MSPGTGFGCSRRSAWFATSRPCRRRFAIRTAGPAPGRRHEDCRHRCRHRRERRGRAPACLARGHGLRGGRARRRPHAHARARNRGPPGLRRHGIHRLQRTHLSALHRAARAARRRHAGKLDELLGARRGVRPRVQRHFAQRPVRPAAQPGTTRFPRHGPRHPALQSRGVPPARRAGPGSDARRPARRGTLWPRFPRALHRAHGRGDLVHRPRAGCSTSRRASSSASCTTTAC